MQKILITGASGFVGGFLVSEALNRGLDVYAAIRPSSDLSHLKDERIHLVHIDFEDVDALTSLLVEGGYDYIIHNAGVTKTASPEIYHRVNASYLGTMLDIIEEHKISLKKFTFISSLAAKGPAEYTPTGTVTEASTPHPVTNYGRSKLAAESILKQYDDIPHVIIRPTAVYGPREKDLFTVYELINKGLEMTVGLQDQQLTFIYVKDLTRVIIDATLADKRNVAYFVTDLEVYTSTEYNHAIRKALGKKYSLKLRLPIPIVRTLGFLAEKIGSLSGTYPALNLEKVNELEAKSWKCDTSSLERDLSFVPQYDLHRGLAEAINWYRQNNWIK